MIPPSSPRPSISNPSIPDRFFGLISGVAEHLLALFSLASLEAQALFKKTITLLLLLIVIVAALLIAYLALLTTVSIIAVTQFQYNWSTVFEIITVAHLVIAGLLLLILRYHSSSSLPFEKTTIEIQHDLEALASSSTSNANNF
jgi:uncharacterized membrane protein YqjE